MFSFSQLKKNLKKENSHLKKIKLAILADSASQLFAQALKGYAFEENINLEVYEADYNQVDLQILDPDSELYSFNPDFLIIFHSTQKLIKKFYKTSSSLRSSFAKSHIEYIQHLSGTINLHLKSKIIYFNFQEINDNVFGNFANKTESSFIYQLRKINFDLMNLAIESRNLFINDLSSLQNQIGITGIIDHKVYINADMVFSLDFLPAIAKNTMDIIQSIEGKFKKCLILDLDNTLWGGIIGDDGMENIQIGDLGIGKAFTELQLWVRELKERGIILAICSKNTEHIAKEPFEKHPDMILKLEDIAVFMANWETKVDNINFIRSVLNIGFDSMVFIDDNPFERNIVRSNIEGITVPELPEDPAEYLSFLRNLNLFETASFTDEDTQRTRQYQEEASRVVLQKSFKNEEDFLISLNMISEVNEFNKFSIPRVAQLSQRSNQFNLRTIRYTDEDINTISCSKNHFGISFSLEDKYGDYGLISLIILEKLNDHLFIDTWLMSCRVLKRGMEGFVLNKIVEIARMHGYPIIRGGYIPTSRNEMVKDHYKNLGFEPYQNFWDLAVEGYNAKQTFINIKANEIAKI